ncbi:MAG: aminotransferase class V-fold PLP-dependent enzyme, partial [Bacteroidales bacterium]|nr:aminotransferase class V-fold PLP-dependent enzyme [Bacteroidales bacterium]
MTALEFRQLFPALDRKLYGKPLVYFDNAATSQRPLRVVERYKELSETGNANIYRAVHTLSAEATRAYEQGREAARAFLNASSREEIIFTGGCTSAINTVAYSFGEAFVGPGDILVVGEAEHHSNLVPWQQLCSRRGAKLEILPVDDKGHWKMEVLRRLLSEQKGRVKLVALAHISNVLGLVNPVEEAIRLCHTASVPVLLDGAQGIVHETVDVQRLDCDFYAFSAHKLYGPTGVGVLYGKKKWLEKMPPFLCGGEMVDTVTLTKTTFAPLPHKFEAGTGNFTAVGCLPETFETALLAREKEVAEPYEAACEYLKNALESRSDVHLYGAEGEGYRRSGVFSFTVDGAHHEDLAQLLDKMGVA